MESTDSDCMFLTVLSFMWLTCMVIVFSCYVSLFSVTTEQKQEGDLHITRLPSATKLFLDLLLCSDLRCFTLPWTLASCDDAVSSCSHGSLSGSPVIQLTKHLHSQIFPFLTLNQTKMTAITDICLCVPRLFGSGNKDTKKWVTFYKCAIGYTKRDFILLKKLSIFSSADVFSTNKLQ